MMKKLAAALLVCLALLSAAPLAFAQIGPSAPQVPSGGGTTLTPGQLPGTATNDNASAGNVGEYVSTILPAGSAVSMTTATAKTVTSISLTAGDWDCWGSVSFTQPGTTVYVQAIAAISTTTNSVGSEFTNFLLNSYAGSGTAQFGTISQQTPIVRESLSATTTVFLTAQTNFTTSTSTAYGTIRCRRAR